MKQVGKARFGPEASEASTLDQCHFLADGQGWQGLTLAELSLIACSPRRKLHLHPPEALQDSRELSATAWGARSLHCSRKSAQNPGSASCGHPVVLIEI